MKAESSNPMTVNWMNFFMLISMFEKTKNKRKRGMERSIFLKNVYLGTHTFPNGLLLSVVVVVVVVAINQRRR